MDKETVNFLSALLHFFSSLLWPGVFVWFVVRFRAQIERLLNRLTSADVAGQKFVFQQPSSDAPQSPPAKVEISQIDPDGFFTDRGIREIVNESGLLPQGEVALDQLLLFDNKRQHTWLVASKTKMAIVLDDPNTRQGSRLIQRLLDAKDVFPLDFRVKQNRYSVVGFGNQPKPGWYYSRFLFPTPEVLEHRIRSMFKQPA